MKRIVCIVALAALVSVVLAGAEHADMTYYADYYGNPACLGEPNMLISWHEIEPASGSYNCSEATGGWMSPSWQGSSEACPTTPGSEWYVTTNYNEYCNNTAYGNNWITGQCTSYNDDKKRGVDAKRGAYEGSYFLSCSNHVPVNPYIKVQEVATCQVPPPNTVTREGSARVQLSSAIFSNAAGSCLAYYNTSDFSGYLTYATYVKIPAVCDPAASSTFDVSFYNDSTCTHLQYSGSFELGCATIPGFANPLNITCLAPETSTTPSGTTPSGTTPTQTPTNSASPLSLSLVLLAFLVIALTVLIM